MKYKRIHTLALLILSLFSSASFADITTEKGGDTTMYLINIGALASTLFYEKGWQGSQQYVLSTLTAQGITEGLKHVVNKTRPNGNCCNSFPSGHAAGSFSAATFLHFRYRNPYVTLPAYLAASYVALSRVEADKHYVEDVLVGATIGASAAYFFTDPYAGQVQLTPLVTDKFIGMHVSTSF